MRNGDIYGLAVRRADGQICAQRLLWRSCFNHSLIKRPFIRGFPILIETLVNGIQAVNRSAALVDGSDSRPGAASAIFSLGIAAVMALALFVLAPHLLSLFMLNIHMGGDVDGFSFHVWDGFFKAVIFMAYIWIIAFVPDIRRVLQYHGAEHKTIHAWENSDAPDASMALQMSRLHPRCGTTFLLFVILLSIAAQAVLVPIFVAAWQPGSAMAKHLGSIAFKLALVIPVSSVAYELIRFTGSLPNGLFASILQAPGLCLQRLTTLEPEREQIDVALVALAEALDYEDACLIKTPEYSRMPSGISMLEMR